MLKITIPSREWFDERTQEFGRTKECNLQLEHSLVSLSKWESKWHKPFLTSDEKTFEETLDYIKCMTITQNVEPSVYNFLTAENIKEINDYISNPMTATTISKVEGQSSSREIITSELIYYWMVALNIPFECQKWHINRLITLIRVCEIKNQPDRKMGTNEVMRRNAALNAARRQKHNTRG